MCPRRRDKNDVVPFDRFPHVARGDMSLSTWFLSPSLASRPELLRHLSIFGGVSAQPLASHVTLTGATKPIATRRRTNAALSSTRTTPRIRPGTSQSDPDARVGSLPGRVVRGRMATAEHCGECHDAARFLYPVSSHLPSCNALESGQPLSHPHDGFHVCLGSSGFPSGCIERIPIVGARARRCLMRSRRASSAWAAGDERRALRQWMLSGRAPSPAW